MISHGDSASGTSVRKLNSIGVSALVRIGTFPITAFATFATTSMMIGYSGALAYAALTVVMTLSQFAPYADLGIGAGVINSISTSRPGDPVRIKAAASAVRILIVSAGVVFVIGAVGAAVFSWTNVLNLQTSGIPDVNQATFLIITIFALAVPLGVGNRILVALSLNPLAIAIGTIVPVTGLIGTALIVHYELPIVFLAFPAALGGLLSSLIAVTIAFRKLEFPITAIFRRKETRLPGLISQGIWFLLLGACLAVAFQWGRVVLAGRGTLSDVASYSLANQFYSPLWSFFLAAGLSLWPILAGYRASNASQSSLLIRMSFYFVGAALISLAGLVVLGPWVASLISHNLVRVEDGVFVACGILICVQALQLVLGMSLTSGADLRFQALWSIPMALSVAGAMWLFAPFLGAMTPFLAAAAGVAIFQVVPNLLRISRNERSAAMINGRNESS